MGNLSNFDSKAFRWFERSLREHKIRDPNRLEALARVDRAIISAGLEYPAADLDKLARHLGVRQIRYLPLGIEGRIVTGPLAALFVEVNESLSAFAKRFALAHELAHLIVGDRPIGVPYPRFEETCDICAKEILLPDDFLRDALIPAPDQPNAIFSLSSDSGLPPDFVLLRAIDAAAIPALRVYWCQARTNRFVAIRSLPPQPPYQLADIKISERSPYPLTEALKSKSLLRGELLISTAGGPDVPTQGSCLPLQGDDVLLILDPATHRPTGRRRLTRARC